MRATKIGKKRDSVRETVSLWRMKGRTEVGGVCCRKGTGRVQERRVRAIT